MITWSIVYVMIIGLLYGLNQWLAHYPIYLRAFVLSGLMVFALQYLVFPVLEKLRKIKIK